MDQKIINLFDEYTHKPLTRQDFISRLIKLTGSTAAAMAVLPLLEVNYAHATTVHENDDDVRTLGCNCRLLPSRQNQNRDSQE